MGAGESVKYDFKGLVTAPGRIARSESSCLQANNLISDAPGVIRKRRGWRRLTALASGLPWKIFSYSTLGSQVLISRGLAGGSSFLQLGNGTALWANPTLPDSGQIRGTPSTRPMGAQSLRSFYVTGLDAPVRVEPDIASSLVLQYAGMPRGLPGDVNLTAPLTAGSNLGVGYARAYRQTWHRYDADGVLLSGPPTARVVIRNQTGTPGYGAVTADVRWRGVIPRQWGTTTTALNTSFFWRLWATRTWNAAGGEQGDDEMYLIAEGYLTAPEIAAGYINTYVDSTPDVVLIRAPRLNTNAQNFAPGDVGLRQGLVNADEPPPVAYEVATWQGCTWWSDVRRRPIGYLTLLSTSGTGGLQNNDTVSVQIGVAAPIVMTAKTAPVATTDFQIYNSLATVQMNLEATARDFANKFNQAAVAAASGLRCYTVALPYTQSGGLIIEAARIDTSGVGLFIGVSRATAWSYDGSQSGFGVPGAPGFGGEQRNAVMFSKPARADAVPTVNTLLAGPNGARVLRTIPYRDRLFVFTDAGLYVVTGTDFSDFAIQGFALDLKLLAREAVCVCDDAIYAWCTAGIAKVSDGGWEIISTVIEPTIQNLLLNTQSGNGVPELAFAVGDTQQHRVLFWYPENGISGDVNGCAFALAWDTRNSTWSTYSMASRNAAGFIDARSTGTIRYSDGRVLLSSMRNTNDSEGYIYEERLDYASTDFLEDDSLANSVAINSTLQLQFQQVDVGGAVHWQQTTVQLDAGEQSWRGLPTAITATWNSETQLATPGGGVINPTSRVVRLEPGRDVRRANQLSLTLIHGVAEYFGIVGVAQRFAAGSKFPKRTR